MRRELFIILFLVSTVFPTTASAAVGPYLKLLYGDRPDLQALFDAKTYAAKPGADTSATGLEDWARQYGWRGDKKLLFYKPKGKIPEPIETASAPTVSAAGYVVVDKNSGLIIAEKTAGDAHPIASLTKLMTADVVLSHKVSLTKRQIITADDQVGGSRLGVAAGTKFSVNDLFYAALLPSANDAANALADATGLTREKFVAAMNAMAQALGLNRTVFADPTGLDEGNVSTPREFAVIAKNVFNLSAIRRYTTTAKQTLRELPSGKKFTVKNSDSLLTLPQYDDVLVTASKTGFLGADVGWNLAVGLKSAKGAPRELILVLMGEPKLAQSAADANTLAKWVWTHYKWK
jgi:serine-type D-Ala-D-Ala endopeptidase (penicillin-binding protein 7)